MSESLPLLEVRGVSKYFGSVNALQDISLEVAMRLGVSYPRGPLAWGQQWGTRTVLTILDSLENWYRDGHYRAAPALRRAVLAGGGPMTGSGLSAIPGGPLPLPRNPT